MRILFSSHVFAPSIGGLEKVSDMLAAEFVRQGHEVRLITETAAAGPDDYPFSVIRRPSARQLFELVRWCEVLFHNNISLPKVWPLLFLKRPWVVAHHVWIPRTGLAAKLKRLALRHAHGISISQAIAAHLGTPSVIIPNPYDNGVFRVLEGSERRRDFVFLGRLVSDKGADLLLSAMAMLRHRGLSPTLTIIGSGPEEAALRAQSAASGLATSVDFAGARSGDGLVRLLNGHRMIVIPSLWQEPFGIVALEGMACGCVPVGSADGGLADAVGDCGETFPNGDGQALARVLERLLRDPARQAMFRERVPPHLRRHECSVVAAEYLQVLKEAAQPVAGPGRRDHAASI